jgi:hypothetical protein
MRQIPARAEEGRIRTARMGTTGKQGARARAKPRMGAERGGGQQGEVRGYAREPRGGVGEADGARVRRVERYRRRLSERQKSGPGSMCGRRAQRWAPHEEVEEWWDPEGAGERVARRSGRGGAHSSDGGRGGGRGKGKKKRKLKSGGEHRRTGQPGARTKGAGSGGGKRGKGPGGGGG